MLITFEGIDGVGKSTQTALLADELRSRGLAVIRTREPGGTDFGRKLRRILEEISDFEFRISDLEEDPRTTGPEDLGPVVPWSCSPQIELFLYMADRAQHVAELIRPALDRGLIVISDRYVDSSLAFQGYGRGLPIWLIKEMNRLATGGLMPNVTILLDVDVDVAIDRQVRRAGSEFGRFEREGREFHERVRNGYLELARQEPDRMRVVDARGSIEETHAKVMAATLPCLMMS